MAVMPGILPEAALFSVIRPNQLRPEVVVSSAIDRLPGRSLSLKMPLKKKASFRVRGWVKRSDSSRTATASDLSASESLKAHIKHLGGGRLDEVVVKGTTNNTTLLAPVPKRAHRSRASSSDSRVTQWLDFYTGSPEPNKPQARPLPESSTPDHPPQASRHQRPPSHTDLRPAPLRVPSSEGRGGPSPPPKPLTRKNSAWKPLPNLPAQPEAGTAATQHVERTKTQAHSQQTPSVEPEHAGLGLLPMIRFDTPPPTPDSSAGGAATTPGCRDRGKGKGEEERTLTAGPNANSAASSSKANPAPQPPPERNGLEVTRHSRQERVWLHVNYRGEAPFLRAWGLEITKLADRLEGLAIVRELIQAEGERKSMEDPI
ncbi:hypothetical protein C8A00DRAFT_33598 [Chaetomidium leptoderma]|uniref:Uncharacterized protein n=1 Tax=Chaetomidium leptoderma TaxID=669021 RepID=A0AAN6VLA0_9PEZI|nr:hypothetical protein C8A00DRAFT_33598 [Chaetomidium leptoderma]